MLARVVRLGRTSSTLTLMARGIQFASQLAMVLLVPKALAPEVYMQLNLVLPLAFLGVSLAFGWLTNAIYRHVFELLDPKEFCIKQTVFVYYGCISLVLLTIFLIVSQFTDSVYKLVPLLLIAAGLKNAVLGVLNASGSHKAFFLANLGFAASLAVFIVLCFVNTNDDLAQYLIIYGVLDTVLAIVAWRLIGVVTFRPRPRFDTDIAVRYFRYGLPMVGSVIAVWVISLSDRYLLAIWEPASVVAGYILSYQLAGSVITIPLSFAVTVIFPKILRLDKMEGEAAALSYTYRLLGNYLRYMVIIFVAACSIVLPFKYYVYPAYEFSPAIIIVIVLAHVIQGLVHFYNKEFELSGRTLVVTKAVFAGAAVNVGLNLALIPPFGALGAAIATLVAYAANVLVVFRARQFKPRVV